MIGLKALVKRWVKVSMAENVMSSEKETPCKNTFGLI